MRIDKFLSNAGIASRADIKIYFKKNRVTCNDILIKHGKIHIDENKDVIKVDGKIIKYKPYYYFVLNKPKGYVSANIDNIYPTVLEFFKDLNIKDLSHVGRLDLDTTGVLLLTNDGKLNHDLIDPKNNIEKIYHAILDKDVDESIVEAAKKGIKLENKEVCKPATIKILDKNRVEIILTEGKYHQVKRMMRALGYEVIELNRVSFAGLTTKNISQGKYYELNDEEVNHIKSLIN